MPPSDHCPYPVDPLPPRATRTAATLKCNSCGQRRRVVSASPADHAAAVGRFAAQHAPCTKSRFGDVTVEG